MEQNDRKIRLGETIKALRNKEGLSQRSFCLMVNVNRAHLEKIESGTTSAGIDVLCRIADGLGVKVRDLIDF